ncbi:hypothetical protein L0026_34715 (plasmid) [Pseudomonas aeruginosa]|uniref:hypothetical protein n=1 Tax=Pseudomonas aeruginosa TaxID=287 RepID=UPI001FF74BAF|nr:hypothetical protein [Pseudomonas aeruginosa]UPG16778.1 hypothetical protein L0026_34715 [Pseudomonas aeruginosa]
MDPSGQAGEQLVDHVDLDHFQEMATGAGGAEHLVAWIRPARPASSWWITSTSITSKRWPPAPAAPSTWCRRFVRHGRRAVGGAVDLDHAQGIVTGAGGAEHLVAWIRPARPASSWWITSTSSTSRGWPPAPAAPSTWCRRFVRHGRRAVGGAVDLDHAQGMVIGAGGAEDLVHQKGRGYQNR